MSDPNSREDEVEILNQLFETGLEYFHLRKPDWTETVIRELLNQIDRKHYSNIIIHYHFELQKEFNLKGIHLGEQQRIDMEEDLDDLFKDYDYISSSIHEPETINTLKRPFQYIFCSPIFPSISKANYLPKHDWNVKEYSENEIELIGLGGVNADNVLGAKEKGFDGVGVLGKVWNSENPVASFREIKEVCDQES